MKTLFLLIGLLATTVNAHASVRENGGMMAPAAIKIEFFSPGNGIDSDLKEEVKILIEEYRQAELVDEYTESGFGMEGEVTLCVMLNDLDASSELSSKLEELVKAGERKTNLSYGPSCKPKKLKGPFELK